MKCRDFLNNEIKVGDVIAYALRKGNSSELKIGRVLEIYTRVNYYAKLIPIIKAKSICRTYDGRLEAQIKESSLESFEKILVIPKSTLTGEALSLLNLG